MRLSRKALDAYNAAIKEQGGNAEKAAQRALDTWFAERPNASIAQTRNFCIQMMDEICTLYGNAAGDAAYALRDIVMNVAGIEPPAVYYEYDPGREYIDEAVRYQAGKLKTGDMDGFRKATGDAARYFAERGGNDTMTALGQADGKKLGKEVRFARVPTGTTTCPYCCMLASRGFVYSSELKALNANHRNCDCRIVEGFEGMEVEGYDPDKYYDMWKHPEKYETQEHEQQQIAKSLVDRPFSGVSSIDEASEYAKRFVDLTAYKSKLDMKGMNVEAANSMLKALDTVYDAYDVAPLRSIQRMNKRSSAFKNTTAEAAYQWSLGDLFYNADYVKTTKAMMAHREDGMKLLDDVLSMDIDAYLRKNAGNQAKVRYAEALRDTHRAVVAQSYENYEELVYVHECGHMLDDRLFRREKDFDRRASFEKYGRGISAYASSDVKEYIAESFTAYYVGETTNLDPELVAIFDRMRR